MTVDNVMLHIACLDVYSSYILHPHPKPFIKLLLEML